MPRIVKVQLEGQQPTWTVVGEDHLPVPHIEEFLEHLRVGHWAPMTIKAYALTLSRYFRFLDLVNADWHEVGVAEYGGFLRWLRTGLVPSVTALGPEMAIIQESSVATYSAGVLSFYRFQLDTHDVPVARRLYRQRVGPVPPRQHPHYRPRMLGLRPAAPADVPVFRLEQWKRRPTPVLTPVEVQQIMSACGGDPSSGSATLVSVRDRLLLETLAEKGCGSGRRWP